MPLTRKGWDHVCGGYGAPFNYCRGPWLVAYTGRRWTINHPDLPQLSNMNFSGAVAAMTFVEENFREV